MAETATDVRFASSYLWPLNLQNDPRKTFTCCVMIVSYDSISTHNVYSGLVLLEHLSLRPLYRTCFIHTSTFHIEVNAHSVHSYSNESVGISSGFSKLPKGTSACRLGQPGFKIPTFQLVHLHYLTVLCWTPQLSAAPLLETLLFFINAKDDY